MFIVYVCVNIEMDVWKCAQASSRCYMKIIKCWIYTSLHIQLWIQKSCHWINADTGGDRDGGAEWTWIELLFLFLLIRMISVRFVAWTVISFTKICVYGECMSVCICVWVCLFLFYSVIEISWCCGYYRTKLHLHSPGLFVHFFVTIYGIHNFLSAHLWFPKLISCA